MKRSCLMMLALAGLAAGKIGISQASGPHKGLPACEPGYKWEPVTEYREVCRDVCKIVPDVKKTTKWVYSQIDDPFCINRCGGKCGHDCPSCEGPYCRKQLVKRQVVCEEPTTKCVVEKVIEKVACTTYRKVPCDTAAPASAGATEATTRPLPAGAATKKQ